MSKKVNKLLKSYQQNHAANLVNILQQNHICFDGSETGTGKTYSAIAVAKLMKLNVFIICTKTIMAFWKNVADIFGVNVLGISNYSLLIKCKHHNNKQQKVVCPYVKISDNEFGYEWNLPNDTLIIFDEVHKCSSTTSLCGKLLLALKDIYDNNHYLLLLSATICEAPSKFKLYGVLLKWFSYINNAPPWLATTYNPVAASKIITDRLFKEQKMCLVKISDLGDQFQKNQVSADFYDIDKKHVDLIDSLHDEIKLIMAEKANGFIHIMRQLQKIEMFKVQIFMDLAEEYIENNFSVIIFVNFTKTLTTLASKLKTKCVVYGEQTMTERLKNINDFIDDKQRIIICNMQTGCDSISLNDKNGVYKRISLIAPTFSSIKLIQACGRNSRIDSKTPSFNKIIYANTLCEKNLCNKIKNKCSMYTNIRDEDLFYE